VRIEGAERGVIHGFGQERQCREELTACFRQRVEAGFEDVVALLDEVEVGEVELAATGGVGSPGIEIPLVRKVIVDETGQDAGDEGMTVAMALEEVLNGLRGAIDTA